MLLVMDVGNTNITLGVYNQDKLVFESRLMTERNRTRDQYAVELAHIFSLYGLRCSDCNHCMIGSVVPELTAALCGAVQKVTGAKPMVLSPGIRTGLNIKTDNPAEVGADLVAGAVAALAKYEMPCLVLDLGTATKISVMDKTGAFCGCTISPGVSISLDALSSRTSQLPAISFKTPATVIGKNTVDSMQSGIVFGVSSMLDGMCDKIEQELSEPVATVVATGGLSQDIVKSCCRKVIHDKDLVLDGLRLIYQKNQK